MGKLVLISGSNNSGKSVYAEQLIGMTRGKRWYIATMDPQTEDNFARIEKHRRQRRDLDFTTLELPFAVGDAPVGPGDVVLLEDVSNLLANVIFAKGGTMEQVLEDILSLKERCALLIAVTIGGLTAHGCDEATAAYVDGLNRLNQLLQDRAEAAAVLKEHRPLWQKGSPEDVI